MENVIFVVYTIDVTTCKIFTEKMKREIEV